MTLRTNSPQPAWQPKPRPSALRLSRAFVETGDERCPIAGVWSRLAEPAAPTDEAELPQPAIWSLLPWRALHFIFTPLRYTVA